MSKKGTQVKLYSSRQCHHCKQTKAYLQRNAIPFVEYDIERNHRALKEFQRAGGRGVPLIAIGSLIVNGFNQPQLTKALKKAGFDV